jgi:hypothetical protein
MGPQNQSCAEAASLDSGAGSAGAAGFGETADGK